MKSCPTQLFRVFRALGLLALLLASAFAEETSIPVTRARLVQGGRVNLGELARRPELATLYATRQRTPPNPSMPPENLPVPAGALRRHPLAASGRHAGRPILSSQVGGTVQLSDLLPSPAPTASFQGLDDDGSASAPDTSGAVGPAHVMTVLNSQIRIQGRDGVPVLTTTLDRFFSVLGDNVFAYDPRCVYDPYGQRWILTAALDPDRTTAGIALAVSLSSDPTGDWYRYSVGLDARDALFADSPVVGFNVRWIAVQANVFNQASGEFVESQVLAFDKGDAYAGGSGAFARFHLAAADYGGSQIPATTMDPSLEKLYLVKSWNGSYAETAASKPEGLLRLFTLSGAVGSEQLTPGSFINTGQETFDPPFTWADSLVSGADLGIQNGTTHRIQLGDSRIQSVLYRGGTVWCSQTVLLPAAAPTRSGVQWWEAFEDGRLFQRHLVDDATGQWSYAYPSLTVNNHYDALLGYNGFASAIFPSAYYRFYPSDGTYNNPQGERLMHAGEGTYLELYQGQNRWGDWSATCVDPLNDGAFWTLQEYALSPVPTDAGRWGVWWSQVVPPYDLRVDITPSPARVAVGQPFTWALTVSNALLSFAYGVRATVPLPPGFAFQSVETTNGTAFLSNNIVYARWDTVGVARQKCEILGYANGSTTNVVATATVIAFGAEADGRSSSGSVNLVNAQPLLAPELEITPVVSSGTLILSWPVGYLGMQLEARHTLNGELWSPVSEGAQVKGSVRVVELPAGPGERYYRLRWAGN